MSRVICSVSSSPVGRNRLTLQSVCRPDGIRALRPVWEQKGEDDQWQVMAGPPEFSPRYWVDVIGKAAAAGLLGSQSYKDLVVNLARGLDSSRTPSPKAYLQVDGIMVLTFGEALLSREGRRINEARLYQSLEGINREVSCFQERRDEDVVLTFQVTEELHYDKVIRRLGPDLGERAAAGRLDTLLAELPKDSFEAIFGLPALEIAGFDDEALYSTTFEVRAS